MLFRTPQQFANSVLQIVERVVPGGRACYVDVSPRKDGNQNECFATVAAQIDELGGSIQHGWAIWEWPNVIIEAEFHAVWRHPDGSLLDVTPRADDEQRVLFVPDPSRVFDGRSIDNVRLPLREDPRVREFIGLAKKRFEILNRGERARQRGTVKVRKDEIDPVMSKMLQLQVELAKQWPGRNDPCHCGSGKKFKKCHGGV